MGDSPKVRLSGVGLHSGIYCNLDLILASENQNEVQAAKQSQSAPIRFSFPGLADTSVRELMTLPRYAERSTVLVNKKGDGPNAQAAVIQTPEHLLAAMLFFANHPILVNCDASELPGLDGSALPYREALSKLLPQTKLAPAWNEYPCDLNWTYDWGYGHLSVRPSKNFQVHYTLERNGFRQSFTLGNPVTAWHEILPARTFAFYSDWQKALASGLMAGAGLDSGLLLAETEVEHRELLSIHREWSGGAFPLLNQPAWRMENEVVKHKILDLLGDLALAGLALPKLEVEIHNGGHSINHLLLEKLSLN